MMLDFHKVILYVDDCVGVDVVIPTMIVSICVECVDDCWCVGDCVDDVLMTCRYVDDCVDV
jgi:hypothetical protein